LLANVIRWAAGDRIPLSLFGPGLIDCHLYRQPGRLVLHLVNLSHPGTWRPPLHELTPIGPFEVAVKLPEGVAAGGAQLLVADQQIPVIEEEGWARFEVAWITDHEVVVIS
ncbi:MAG: Tat pathway signal protein, partial [Anaerolineae bacterium]|nr:Tat pathway signal protein [Anaerolineae bacterium]